MLYKIIKFFKNLFRRKVELSKEGAINKAQRSLRGYFKKVEKFQEANPTQSQKVKRGLAKMGYRRGGKGW